MKNSILQRFQVPASSYLGEGGEAWVYALDEYRILKIYKNHDLKKNIPRQQQFLHSLNFQTIGLDDLHIYTSGVVDESLYTIEKRIRGVDLGRRLQTLSGDKRKQALCNFYETAKQISDTFRPKQMYFREVFYSRNRYKKWPRFLVAVAQSKPLPIGSTALQRDKILKAFAERCETIEYAGEPKLVHFDYYPTNVIERDLSMAAIIDFSLAIFGDPRMDIAGAVGYLPLEERITLSDYQLLLRKMFGDYKDDINTLTTYLIYLAIYWNGSDIPRLFEWSSTILVAWQKDNFSNSDRAIWESIEPPLEK